MIAVVAGASLAYAIQHQVIAILLVPSKGQEFIYTSPIGGINFLLGISLRFGIVLATPVIVYQLLAFLAPLMKQVTRRFIVWMSIAMFVVAVIGLLFGYYIGLPSALNFLLHQFHTVQIKPLITIQSYMSFVSLYLFGSALMFQLPLIIIIINRIKPLTPSMLFKYERHLIVGALLIAFIMNPSPNILDQLFVVVPIILMYQASIVMVWYMARRRAKTAPRAQWAKPANIAPPKHTVPHRATTPLNDISKAQPAVLSTNNAPQTKAARRSYTDPMVRPLPRATVTKPSVPPRRRLIQ